MHYKLTKADKEIDNRKVTVYGVALTDKHGKTAVSDVSADKNFVKGVVRKLKKGRVQRDFLLEIVEDLVTEHYSL